MTQAPGASGTVALTGLVKRYGDGDVGGCADVVNIHYPQCGPGGSLYPGQDYPRSAFWLGRVDVFWRRG